MLITPPCSAGKHTDQAPPSDTCCRGYGRSTLCRRTLRNAATHIAVLRPLRSGYRIRQPAHLSQHPAIACAAVPSHARLFGIYRVYRRQTALTTPRLPLWRGHQTVSTRNSFIFRGFLPMLRPRFCRSFMRVAIPLYGSNCTSFCTWQYYDVRFSLPQYQYCAISLPEAPFFTAFACHYYCFRVTREKMRSVVSLLRL